MAELLVWQQDCDQAIEEVARTLTGNGLKVVRSFDLRQAWRRKGDVAALGGLRAAASFDLQLTLDPPAGCHCPHHGAAPCDCQMVVMLVYGPEIAPATLVAHGHDGVTWFTLVDTPEQRPSSELAKRIATAVQFSTSLHNVEMVETAV